MGKNREWTKNKENGQKIENRKQKKGKIQKN